MPAGDRRTGDECTCDCHRSPAGTQMLHVMPCCRVCLWCNTKIDAAIDMAAHQKHCTMRQFHVPPIAS